MPLLVGLVLLILAEVTLYVTLGAAIGLTATLAVVLGTGVAGVLVVRSQGRHMVERLVETAMDRRNPLRTAGDGMLVALAGVLLVLPGFLTDVAGLVLMLPPVRRAILDRIAQDARRQAANLAMKTMLTPHPSHAGPHAPPAEPEGEIIDGEAVDLAPGRETPESGKSGHRPSGWTRR